MIVALLAVLLQTTQPQVHTASFAYTIGAAWENSLTGKRLDTSGCHEMELETGDNPASSTRVLLNEPPVAKLDSDKVATYSASADSTLSVTVSYGADPKWPIMHKSAEITNRSDKPIRLLNVVLGRYPLGDHKAEGGDLGFPLYIDQQFFISLTHPAGLVHIEGNDIVLRQYPGVVIAPGATFRTMEAVYGVAKKGEARKLFVDYVRSRMARVLLHHDKPYAIMEAFGGQPDGDFRANYAIGISESYVLHHLQEVADSQRYSGTHFDFYGLEFWHERSGDLKEFSRANWPNGFAKARNEILKLGMRPGLWVASAAPSVWTIDLNPAVKDCFTAASSNYAFCRASEPIDQIYKDGFTYQIQQNHAGLLKFDNLEANCVNPAHNHLPGLPYSREAIYNGVIDFLTTIRHVDASVFIMLYWGYRSPWWLQYGDTYFECGDQIEAASPAQFPTPFARDAVTQRLDQAQRKITDTPWIGKDSLGVWLSDWTWNSGIGKARWQEGVIMDMARGGLLFQMWTDADWLTAPERAQVATFIDLMKANANCFDNCRFIIGNPDKAEPYGYSCTNGKRAFLAINNASMQDRVVKLDLGPAYGLSEGKKWDLYRWYPHPAHLSFGAAPAIAMRPYEVTLLEVVPAGSWPSLGRSFGTEIARQAFAEKSRPLTLASRVETARPEAAGKWETLSVQAAVSAKGSALTVLKDGSIRATGGNPSNGEEYVILADVKQARGLMVEAIPDDSLPAQGPGRAVNGNFALTDLRVRANTEEVKLRAGEVDFEQSSFGGWPASAAVDGDPKTGWSIHPAVGESHAAVFEFDRTVTGTLAITLANGDNFHNLGRFRLSTTSGAPSLPIQYQPGIVTLTTEISATKGGLFVLVGGSQEDAPRAWLGGQAIPIESVWASRTNWGCPWVAWRAEIGPTDKAKTLKVELRRRQTQAGAAFKAYYLPK